MPKLTPKQARFVDEYLIDLNATQAAYIKDFTRSMSGYTMELLGEPTADWLNS